MQSIVDTAESIEIQRNPQFLLPSFDWREARPDTSTPTGHRPVCLPPLQYRSSPSGSSATRISTRSHEEIVATTSGRSAWFLFNRTDKRHQVWREKGGIRPGTPPSPHSAAASRGMCGGLICLEFLGNFWGFHLVHRTAWIGWVGGFISPFEGFFFHFRMLWIGELSRGVRAACSGLPAFFAAAR